VVVFVGVCLSVCFLATLRKSFQTDLREILGTVGNGPTNKWLNFGGDPAHRTDTGIVFRIHHYWEIRKAANGHSFTLIRQMAALVSRSLAEVCTVPVPLVIWCFYCCFLEVLTSLIFDK